ncbi:MAG: thrombospondin type 3 repeat-containing protein [Pseudomonadota bacterium]
MSTKLRLLPLMLLLFSVSAGAVPILDGDLDGTPDTLDNCAGVANADQRDTDGDGSGNMCDPDLNNDGFINFIDLGQLKSVFFTNNADADLNGDGFVNFVDLGIMKSMFFGTPGGPAAGPSVVASVPEPRTLALVGLGLIMMSLLRGRTVALRQRR